MNPKKNKVGFTAFIVGRQGSGKTPVCKSLAEKAERAGFKNLIVYDRRKEYNPEKFTIYYSLETFKKKLPTFKNSFLIIEEATGFISGYKDVSLSDLLISCEHKNNAILFCFHSLADVPYYIIRLCRYAIILPTNDDPEKVKRERPMFYKYLNNKTDQYINLNNI